MGLDNPVHILLLLIVLLLVFGAKRLPEIGRSLGDGMRGFKDSLSGVSSHDSLPAVQAPEMDVTLATAVPDALVFGAVPSTDSRDVVAMHAREAVATVDSVPQPSAGPNAAA